MLPNNLTLNIGKMAGYNNKILISNTDMKIGSNKDKLYWLKFIIENLSTLTSTKARQSPLTSTKALAAPELHLMESSGNTSM